MQNSFFNDLAPLWFRIILWSLPLIGFLYFVLCEYYLGRTAGKALMGLRVVTVKSDKITLPQSIFRNLARVINVFFSIDYIYSFFDKKHQRLGDKIAKTLVISTSNQDKAFITFVAIVILPICSLIAMGLLSETTKDEMTLKYEKYITAQADFESATEELVNEDFQTSIENFTECLHIFPNHVTALFGRSIAYRAIEDTVKQKQDLDQIISIDSTYSPALIERANLFGMRGDLQSAAKDIDRAIEVGRDLAGAYQIKGFILEAAGKTGEALEYYHKSHSIATQFEESVTFDWSGSFDMIEHQIDIGEMEEAQRMIDKHYHEDWIIADYIALDGVIAYLTQGPEEAKHHFNRAIRIHPTKHIPYIFRAFVNYQQGMKQNAFEDMNVYNAIRSYSDPVYVLSPFKRESLAKEFVRDYKKYKIDLRQNSKANKRSKKKRRVSKYRE